MTSSGKRILPCYESSTGITRAREFGFCPARRGTIPIDSKGGWVNDAARERLKAYGLFVVFVALVVFYGKYTAPSIRQLAPTALPPTPLLIGAVFISLATAIPLVTTFRPSSADNLLAAMREKARRAGKKVTFQSASRTVSLYVVALASTPVLYGVVLLFLIGEFLLLVLLLPAAAILAIVGWFVLGRFFKELSTKFVR
jgi:hypothetical protein